MSRATVELDFFGMEKENSSKSQFQRLLEQRRTVRGIQSAISKINPQLLKTVINSGGTTGNSDGGFLKQETFSRPNGALLTSDDPFSVPSTPEGNQNFLSSVRSVPAFSGASESPPGTPTAPLTIFYNGTISVFDVSHDKAEIIMKFAEKGNSKSAESMNSKLGIFSSSSDELNLLENLNGDLPIARKKSLQRFLEKRKERVTPVSPYAMGQCVAEKKLRESVRDSEPKMDKPRLCLHGFPTNFIDPIA